MNVLKQKLSRIGFWATRPGIDQDEPWPGDYIDWEHKDRRKVLAFLKAASMHLLHGSGSESQVTKERCRLCSKEFDVQTLRDGPYIWPTSLYHYVKDHGVMVPRPFVIHIQGGKKPSNTTTLKLKVPRTTVKDLKALALVYKLHSWSPEPVLDHFKLAKIAIETYIRTMKEAGVV